MADYSSYQHALPHRRPVAAPATHTQTVTSKHTAAYPPSQPSPTHYHSRTASSAIFSPSAPHPSSYAEKQLPMMPQQPQQYQQRPLQPQPSQHQLQQQQYASQPVRRMTNSTVSSRDSTDQRSYPTQNYPQNYSQQYTAPPPQQTLPMRASDTNLRRSTSSRSQASSLGPTSYVALLRKQKATVWCERTQPMDPRVAMQAKAARARAANEILKSSMGRPSMSGSAPSVHSGGGMLSRNKNKQGRTQTGGGGAGANLAAGVGVPMRLSASEVGDEEDDEDDGIYTGGGGGVHKRTGSGRSSINAPGNRLAAPRTNTRLSYGSSKPGSSAGHTPPTGAGTMTSEVSRPTLEHANSFGSTGSEERREREMGDVGDLDAPKAVDTQEKRLTATDLARRGSVDERSATMRGAAGAMRLFVANPDADDSD